MDSAWQSLAIALGLGLLVGLQREWAKAEGAGIRTFALITVLGAVSGLLDAEYGGWVVAAGLVAVASLLAVMNLNRRTLGDRHPGQTTEVAALLMFATGTLLALGRTALAIAIGGTVAILLQWKKPLHGFVDRIGKEEIRGVFRLVLIAMVVLPLLPDQAYGPFDVVNPFRIWLMVVLIVGISLAGYLASKYLGSERGTLAAGVLGGIISSTATTVSYARQSRAVSQSAGPAMVVILVSSTVVFLRVGIEIALVAPSILPLVAPQLALMTVWLLAIAMGGYAFQTKRPLASPAMAGDPSELLPAVIFGGLYALVLLAVAFARDQFGDRGLYVVAALSGLTDMDAITLSTAQLMDAGALAIDTGWRMMLVGALSNIVFKAAVVASLGSPPLLRRVGIGFALALTGGWLLLQLWPAAPG